MFDIKEHSVDGGKKGKSSSSSVLTPEFHVIFHVV